MGTTLENYLPVSQSGTALNDDLPRQPRERVTDPGCYDVCVCMYVLFYACVGIGFVECLEREFIDERF